MCSFSLEYGPYSETHRTELNDPCFPQNLTPIDQAMCICASAMPLTIIHRCQAVSFIAGPLELRVLLQLQPPVKSCGVRLVRRECSHLGRPDRQMSEDAARSL